MAMGNEETLKILIEAQNKAQKAFDEAQKQIKDTEKAHKTMTDSFEANGQKMQSVGKKMTGYMTLPILAGAALSIKAFSNLQETINKVDVSFGSSSKEVKKWSEGSIKSMGLAQQSALDAAALFGDMGTGMGQSQKDAAKMSTGLTQLGADMASFKNVSFDRAQTALAGVYTGETEALKSLGVVMTETNLQEYAASKGIKKKLQDMTQAEKVQLRYNFVMDKTKNAQGDFARTSDSLANKQRVATERAKELSAQFGQKLGPAYSKLLEVGNKVLDWFGKLSDGQQELLVKTGLVAAAIGPVVAVVGSFAKAISGTVKAGAKVIEVTGKMASAGAKYGKVVMANVKFLARYGKALTKDALLKAAARAKTIALMVAEKAKMVATKVATAIQAAFNAVMAMNPIFLVVAAVVALVAVLVLLYKKNQAVRDFIDKAWRAIAGAFSSAFNTIKGAVSNVIDWIKNNWQLLLGFVLGPIALIVVGFMKYRDRIMEVFKAIWGVIKWAWDGIVAVVKWAWENVIKPIWDGLVWYITGVVIPVWKKIFEVVKTVWDGIVTAVLWAWNNAIKPVWDLIWSYITNVVIPVWKKIFEVAKQVWDGVWKAVTTAWAWIKPIFEAVWAYIRDTLVPAFQKIWDKVRDVFTNAWSKISTFITNIKAGFNKIKEWIGTLIDKFTSIRDKIKSAFTTVGDAIKAPFKTAFNWVAGAWNKTLGKLNFTIPDWVPNIGGKKWDMPNMPTLYKGARDFMGGAAIVGDVRGQGGEIINMPRGTDVFTNRESKRILRGLADGQGGGGSVTNMFTGNIYIADERAAKKFFEELNRQAELSSYGVPA
jgi:phage-related protein